MEETFTRTRHTFDEYAVNQFTKYKDKEIEMLKQYNSKLQQEKQELIDWLEEEIKPIIKECNSAWYCDEPDNPCFAKRDCLKEVLNKIKGSD